SSQPLRLTDSKTYYMTGTSSRGRDGAPADAPNEPRRRPGRRGGRGGYSNGVPRDQREREVEQRPTDPSIPAVNIAELEVQPREQLIELAERDYEVENA